MHSLKVQEAVDPVLYEVLREVADICAYMQLDFFVGGAMARDILIKHVYGQDLGRATRDVDIGLYIKAWPVFEQLKTQLIATGKFVEAQGASQRLIYKPNTPLDLIPFGGVEDQSGQISWPPEHDIVLNVVGFEEAFTEAIPVDIGNGLVVRTCSIPSLVALKLIAWGDRHQQTNKDATDFYRIVELYGESLNAGRLYEHELDLLRACDFDPVRAGAILLGKDTVKVCKPEAISVIMDIMQDHQLMQLLQDQITRTKAGAFLGEVNNIELLVNAFFEGFSAAFRLHQQLTMGSSQLAS